MAKWINEFEWVCEKHFKKIPLPAVMGACPELHCITVRPRRNEFEQAIFRGEKPKVVVKRVSVLDKPKVKVKMCAYVKCKRDNGSPAPVRLGSIYCHDNCRKNKARDAYRERKRKEKQKDT